jgi:transcriptional regulator
MYEPAHFIEERAEVLHELIRAFPLGLLVCNGEPGPVANPVPFLLDVDAGGAAVLRCHVARANPQWQLFEAGATALAIFQGPQAYVTPSWYATKAESGKVVPTWNYCVAQARGRAVIRHDAGWLASQAGALTNRHETGRNNPWSMSDAPEAFITAQLRAIVGIEIAVDELKGKWKVSQNRPIADRNGVAQHMAGENAAMAELVARYGRTGEG